ncbi:DUF2267 domain-containing protein [Polymorphospora sp. NPDC050346]|uniref:DUF2267 domain-containing protein n=1 Tax=Polymorphospora sp. NPDC050346 TaxID=3155780 RepID=UPI00340A1608
MRYDKFLADVRERGEYVDRDEAERITTTVLEVLAQRLSPGEAHDLGAQLPGAAAIPFEARSGAAEQFSVREFLERVAEETGATDMTAEWDASAVLSTVADSVTGGELNDVLGQLPSGYAVLFGRPGLSG